MNVLKEIKDGLSTMMEISNMSLQLVALLQFVQIELYILILPMKTSTTF